MKKSKFKFKKGDIYKYVEHDFTHYYIVKECSYCGMGFCEMQLAKPTIKAMECNGLGLFLIGHGPASWTSSCCGSNFHHEMTKLTEAEKLLIGY
jgi:hypothetical protein